MLLVSAIADLQEDWTRCVVTMTWAAALLLIPPILPAPAVEHIHSAPRNGTDACYLRYVGAVLTGRTVYPDECILLPGEQSCSPGHNPSAGSPSFSFSTLQVGFA